MTETLTGWWFEGYEIGHGDGRPVTEGCTLTVEPPIRMCTRGLHAMTGALHALQFARTPIVWRVELGGEILQVSDWLCATRRRHLRRLDATDVLRAFARWCAIDSTSAAVYARRNVTDAARDAARDAVRYTTGAVRAAIKDAQNARLEQMLLDAFGG